MTYVSSQYWRIDIVVSVMCSLAGIGAAVIGVKLLASGSSLPALDLVVVTLGTYLLAGLSPRMAALAASPAVVVFIALGSAAGITLETLGYVAFFLGIANLIGLVSCIRRTRDLKLLVARSAELTGLINTDRLTGIYNRYMFDDHLARVWCQSRRERQNLSLLIVDIDHMEEFNTRYGHPEGDRCIRRVGEALKKSVRRPLDFVARYDGSRFALVLYDPPTSDIRRPVGSIQNEIAELHIPNEGSPTRPRLTVSIGAVVLGPDTTTNLDSAMPFAEEALAASKLRGRDRAVVFQSSDLERYGTQSITMSPATV
jgi:diguanylate cyclase (GGDEF)-like protein